MSKKISLNKEIIMRGRTYNVYICHKQYTFTSRRKAEDFLRAADNYINTQFEAVNTNLISVYATYRRLSWFIHSYDRSSIRLQINEIEQAIELTVSRSDWSSWRDTTFNKLDYSITLLDNILGRMQEISKQKKYTVLSAEIRASINAVQMLKNDADKFQLKNIKYQPDELKIVYKKISNYK